MGEHAVVYGKPALLAAINLRLKVSVEKAKKLDIVSNEPTEYVRHAVECVTQECRLQHLPKIRITIVSDIPAGYHLGSSAAVAVSTVGALLYFLKKMWDTTVVNRIAYEIEKQKHGNPSGGDNTAVTFGGLLWFRKECEFLKNMIQIPFSVPKTLNHFYLIDTGRPIETTGEMVAYVKTRRNLQKFLNDNEMQTKRIVTAFKEGDEKLLIDSVQTGERTLEDVGVVSNKAISMIRVIEKTGGAAKILGGGGKKDGVGYLLCYSHNPPHGAIPIELGGEGVRLEKKV